MESGQGESPGRTGKSVLAITSCQTRAPLCHLFRVKGMFYWQLGAFWPVGINCLVAAKLKFQTKSPCVSMNYVSLTLEKLQEILYNDLNALRLSFFSHLTSTANAGLSAAVC